MDKNETEAGAADANAGLTFLSAIDVDPHKFLQPKPITSEVKRVITFEDVTSLFLQEPSGEEKINVYVRVKPKTKEETLISEAEDYDLDQGDLITIESEFQIALHAPKESQTYKTTMNGVGSLTHRFTFTKVFEPEATQDTFFAEMVRPRVREFLEGQNQLVFTYGATSSGKTYTIQGTPIAPGILPRSLDVIFNSIKSQRVDVGSFSLKPYCFNGVKQITIKGIKAVLEEKDQVISLGKFLATENKMTTSSTSSQHSSCSAGSEFQDSTDSGITNLSAESLATMFPQMRNRIRDPTVIELDNNNILYSIWVSFAEIYNENIYDLLEKMPVPKKKSEKPIRRPPLKLAEDKKGFVYVKGLKEIHVSSSDEAYQLMMIGRENLRFAATRLNHNSSRSHCIFTVKIIRVSEPTKPKLARISILSFCDLAGSERIKKTLNTGARQKEAGNINTSLLVLGRCIKAIRANQTINDPKKLSMIPYRDSKLTRLFQSFFSGMGKVSMIVNISQAPYLFDESMQVLKFAAIANKVTFVKEPAPKKARRQSRFSSIMFEHMMRGPSLTGRGSIAWENPSVRSTMCPPLAPPPASSTIIEEEGEEGDETSYEDVIASANIERYEALTQLIEDLKRQLSEEKNKNLTLESEIRAELCQEFNAMMVEVDQGWQRRLQETTERIEGLNEWRITQLENAYRESRKRKRIHDDSEDDEREEDEKNEKIARLETALEDKTSEVVQMEAQVKAMKKTHNIMIETQSKQQEELSKLKFMNDSKRRQIEKLEEELKTAKAEIQARKSSVESQSANPLIADLEAQLKEVKRTLDDKNEEAVDLKKLLDEAGEEFLSKEKEVSSLRTKLHDIETRYAHQSIALSDAVEEAAMLLTESTARLEEKEQLEDQLLVARQEKNELISEKSKLLLELTKLKEEKLASSQELERKVILSDARETEIQLNKEIEKLEETNAKLAKKVEDLEDKLEQESEDWKTDVRELKEKNAMLQSELVVSKGELQEALRCLNKKSLQDLSVIETKEFEKVEQDLLKEQEIESLKEELSEKAKLLEESTKGLKELKTEFQATKINLEGAVDSLKKEVATKEAYIRELEDIILEKDYKITLTEETMKAEISKMKEDLNKLQDQLQKSEVQVKESKLQQNEALQDAGDAVDGLNENLKKLTESSEEMVILREKLENLEKTVEELEKTNKKIMEEKDRKEKDLNDEIEAIRQSNIKIKILSDEKSKQLSENEKEISKLEREVKSLLQAEKAIREASNNHLAEVKMLKKQLKKMSEENVDTEVLGKKIAEQERTIEDLRSQIQTLKQEDKVIEMLKQELESKNEEKARLNDKIVELQSQVKEGMSIDKLEEKIAFLEAEVTAKEYEAKKCRDEREEAMTHYSKLLKMKGEELVREKNEALKLRDAMMKSTPSKKDRFDSEIQQLKEELERKKKIIEEYERREDEAEDLRAEVRRLQHELNRANATHSRELAKVKKASDKIIKEYKEANFELQRQIGLTTTAEDTSTCEADESNTSQVPPPSSGRKKKGGGETSRSRRGYSSSVASFEESNAENDPEGEMKPKKTTRVTRSRPVRKTKKAYQDSDDNNTNKRTTLKEVFDNSASPPPEAATPHQRRCRRPLFTPGHSEVFSPQLEEENEEKLETPHTIVKRQLRTRRRK